MWPMLETESALEVFASDKWIDADLKSEQQSQSITGNIFKCLFFFLRSLYINLGCER